MTRDRGEYQSIYAALFDGPEFLALDRDARWLLVAMRLTLGATAIASVPAIAAVYAHRTGIPIPDVERALTELQHAGWVEVEGNVAWVVRGLEFSTGLELANKNHRRYVQRHVASLPRLAIVTRFCARYPEWMEGAVPSAPSGMASQSHPEPIAITTTTTKTTTGLVSDAGAREVAYHVRCVVALNRAFASHPETFPHFREVSASEMAGVVSWERDQIPVELAERVIQESAGRYRPTERNRQPNSLKYFDAAVRRAWESEQAKAQLPRSDVPRLPRITA